VRTEFHERAGIRAEAIPGPAWLDAEDVVASALRAWERGRVVHVPSARYKAAASLLRNVPYETVHRLRTKGAR
jgi:hypothetical protein